MRYGTILEPDNAFDFWHTAQANAPALCVVRRSVFLPSPYRVSYPPLVLMLASSVSGASRRNAPQLLPRPVATLSRFPPH